MKKTGFIPASVVVLTATGLLFYSAAVAEGVRTGLENCATLLIPSLFPFMILAALVGSTTAGQKLSDAVGLVLTPLTGLPRSLGAVFFMSVLGGFPVGARMLAQMLEQKEIDADTASRALCCAVNAGPSFLITAVGVGLLGSQTAGGVLLCAQLLSALCLAAMQFLGKSKNSMAVSRPVSRAFGSDAFVFSVRSAATGMLGVCAFVVAFSALSSLLEASGVLPAACMLLGSLFPQLGEGFFAALLSGMLEVTAGCVKAAALYRREGFVLCAFLVSFSSFSILAQVKACFPDGCGVRFAPLLRSRITGGLLSAFFAMLGWQWVPQLAAAAIANTGSPTPSAHPEMLVTGGCLIAMFTILLVCPAEKRHC